MAKGEPIASLYAKLGLDVSELQSDFALADKTVNEAMAKLNHEKKTIKLKTDIDLNGIDEATGKTQRLAVQERGLTQQLDIQRQKVQIMTAAYREVTAAKGADSAASARMETRLLNEQRAYTSLQQQIRRTRAEQTAEASGAGRAATSAGGVGGLLSSISAGQAALAGGASGALGMMGAVRGRLAVGLGTVAGGFGLMQLTQGAMTAGNNIYTLAQKMHTTNAEAAQMSMVFRLAGADANAAVPAIIRLDRSVQSAGAAGNETTRLLQVFGVNLRDANGQLLPVNQQLMALAQGYRNASAAGMENEYVSQVLGARGAALVPVLEQMTELQERAATIKTSGLLNPDDSHQLYIEWNNMKIEAGQLGTAVGAALMPVANELMPEITAAVKDFIQGVQDNKEDIKSLGKVLIDISKLTFEGIGDLAKLLNSVGINGKNADTVLQHVLRDINAIKGAKSAVASSSAADFGLDLMEAEPIAAPFVWMHQMFGSGSKSAASDEALKDSSLDVTLKTGEYQGPKDTAPQNRPTAGDDQTSKNAEQIKQELAAMENAKQVAAANKEVQDEMYGATHSMLQKQLHDIDEKARRYREEGADEASVTAMVEAEKSKIMQDFNDNTLGQINRVWKSELQNRLDDIDRERRAWIQKGVDEVTATRWAEHEKTRARQNEALAMFRENREYLNILRNAMAGPGTADQRISNARMGILMAMRRKMGIENDMTNPEEVGRFSDVMHWAQENLVPGMEMDASARALTQSAVRVYRGNTMTREIPGFSQNITIEGGVFVDRGTISKLADAVGERTKTAYTDATRLQQYTYNGEG
jgi:hypothetical protein